MALEQYCPVIQVVGYQNSGKTTLLEKLIHKSAKSGIQVATIKHHGHGGEPKSQITLKDSERHEKAGAMMTAVEGGGSLHIQIKNQTWSLDKLLTLYESFSPDIIFVEGFKNEKYLKVVLLRSEEDLPLLSKVNNIMCVISWQPLQLSEKDYPFFNINETDKYMQYILQKLSDEYGTTFI
ncbi:molybdopterin-guanine dinucleotide biosynthesis protein B [Halalkalibacter nanhaiisediminis]|uniref:Molybdopterin-guanine dinucleotide biosynthesis protein B n=1 Tax=Halalkalibacter nanhaiisediminis TaxID=688079 RepID=A0A562QQX5_9BACI|nr:molybdopterin-guanine dinucleotide biosynthesis protein B [Halalkalibacter nanhaiisediminis]TWI59149.1 molybdopterin-guanine dinucleotide biosynthesis protein B [Halalkalibacter nanhaiisediminis]